MFEGTVVEISDWSVWVQLDDDCQVLLHDFSFDEAGVKPVVGMRVLVETRDIHCYLVKVLN